MSFHNSNTPSDAKRTDVRQASEQIPEEFPPLGKHQEKLVCYARSLDLTGFLEWRQIEQNQEFFRLGREGMRFGCRPEECRPAFDVLCDMVNCDDERREGFWYVFLDGFDAIQHAPGHDVIWGFEQHAMEPLAPHPHSRATSPADARTVVDSIAQYLWRDTKGRPFSLSRKQLARVLKMTEQGAGAVVRSLVRWGVLAGLKEDGTIATTKKEEYFWYKAKGGRPGQCKRYIYLDPKPLTLAEPVLNEQPRPAFAFPKERRPQSWAEIGKRVEG